MGNLIAFDKEIKVFELQLFGQTIIFPFKEFSTIVTDLIKDMELNETLEIKIRSTKIKESVYYNLPEFDGY